MDDYDVYEHYDDGYPSDECDQFNHHVGPVKLILNDTYWCATCGQYWQ